MSDLAQFPVDAGVEEDKSEERNDAVDHEIEIDNIDLVVIGVLSQLGPNNDKILKNHFKSKLCSRFMFTSNVSLTTV